MTQHKFQNLDIIYLLPLLYKTCKRELIQDYLQHIFSGITYNLCTKAKRRLPQNLRGHLAFIQCKPGQSKIKIIFSKSLAYISPYIMLQVHQIPVCLSELYSVLLTFCLETQDSAFAVLKSNQHSRPCLLGYRTPPTFMCTIAHGNINFFFQRPNSAAAFTHRGMPPCCV